MNKLILIFILGWLALLSGCNQLDLSTDNNTLVVDMAVVAKATGKQEIMQRELEFTNLQLSEQLKLVASRLEESVSVEKEKLGDKPSEEELGEFQAMVMQAQNQLQSTKNLAIQQSTEFRSGLITRFRNEVAEIARDIATNNKSKLVLVVGHEALWFDSSVDITDEVIAVMRQRSNDFEPSGQSQSSVSGESSQE